MSETQRSKKVSGVSRVSDVSKVTKVLTEEISKTHLITQLPETLAITGFTGGGVKHLRPAERLDFAKNGNIIYINHSVIPQQFECNTPELLPCGVAKSTFTHWQTGRPACTTTQLNAKDIQNLSVIPQRFECNTPQLLPCGISNEEHKLFITCGTCAAKK